MIHRTARDEEMKKRVGGLFPTFAALEDYLTQHSQERDAAGHCGQPPSLVQQRCSPGNLLAREAEHSPRAGHLPDVAEKSVAKRGTPLLWTVRATRRG